MYKGKRSLSILLIIIFSLNLFPTLIVNAVEDVNILSETVVTIEQTKEWAISNGATDTFVKLADYYWQYAKSRGGVNPAVAYVQAAKETGYGNFKGVIDESFCNPCGLKTQKGGSDSDPNAHQHFENWAQGVQAHLDHLAVYAGAKGYPRNDTYDPRGKWVKFGSVKTVKMLGGNWTPNTNYGNEVMDLYKSLLNKALNPKFLGEIKTPVQLANISGKKMTITGWAIADCGVEKVDIYVDGKLKSTVIPNKSTPEIANQYSNYPNSGTSAYETTVDISDISEGNKVIIARTVAKDGSIKDAGRTVVIDRLETKGEVKTPVQFANISGKKMTVTGWAIADCGVEKVDIYVDGKLKSTVVPNKSTPEIAKQYPEYPNSGTSGYEATVDISDISTGNKVIIARAVAKDGSIKDAGRTICIEKPESKGEIKTPEQLVKVSGNKMKITGWAIADSGVKKVDIYVDGKLKATVVPNKSTPEIAKQYPNYPNAKISGYEATVDISNLSAGNNVIIARAIAKDGSIKDAGRTIVIDKLESKGEIKTPVQFANISGKKMTITGWAIANSGVEKVELYINGKLKTTVVPNKSTPEIAKQYPAYPNARISGYEATVDISDLGECSALIIAKAIAKDGSIKDAGRTVNIKRLEAKGEIETPVQFENVTENKLKVKGWAIAETGIEKVYILVNGKIKATVMPDKATPNIAKQYPDYLGAEKSGYEVTIDVSDIADGNAVIIAKAVAKDGSSSDAGRTVYKSKLSPKGEIETPIQFANIKENTLNIRGWAIAKSGIREIQIFVDGKYKGSVVPNRPTPNIKLKYPGYRNSEISGYEINVDISDISIGSKVIVAKSISNDGEVKDAGRTINRKNKSLIVIDPGHALGRDEGAIYTHYGITYYERKLNWDIALRLYSKLESEGYSVVLTRNELYTAPDLYTSLSMRAKLANSLKADLFISIHHNANDNSSVNGTEVYYTSKHPDEGFGEPNSDKLNVSKKIANDIVNNLATSVNFRNRGPKDQSLHVTRNTQMPSVLVECGFISNANEAKAVSNPNNQDKISLAILNGIQKNIG